MLRRCYVYKALLPSKSAHPHSAMFAQLAADEYLKYPPCSASCALVIEAQQQLASFDWEADGARCALDHLAQVSKDVAAQRDEHYHTLHQVNSKARARLQLLRGALRKATQPDAPPPRPAASPTRKRPPPRSIGKDVAQAAFKSPFVDGYVPSWVFWFVLAMVLYRMAERM